MYKAISRFFQTCLAPVDRACNFLFGSKYNPLYQSGTIAIVMLATMIVSGVVLVMFYRLAAPYESMIAIESGIYFSRWMRALHRYASDAAVVAVLVHIWRMVAEGKTWGPRVLAWTSGVILTLIMLAIGWTGFVLVWDYQGQRLATIGAELLNAIPLFRGSILHTFSGAAYIGQSFFFMNLFLHMSLPLGMIFGLWIHTMRLNRPVWFPGKRYSIAMIASLFILSVLHPAPLAGPPDLLMIGGEYPLNVFYGFLLPLVKWSSPGATLVGAILLTIFLLSIPFWLRPRKGSEPQKSSHIQAACTGCSQCYQDCPFDAIAMVPRTLGQGSEAVAAILEDYCVGCGICSASCSQIAIGPKSLKPKEQLRAIRDLANQHPKASLLLIHCGGQDSGQLFVERALKSVPGAAPLELTCTGVLHPGSLVYALRYFPGVFVFGCEPRACKNRSGQELLELRVHGERSPTEPGELDSTKIRTAHGSRAEFDDIVAEIEGFAASLKPDGTKSPLFTAPSKVVRYLRSALATALLLAILALLSGVQYSDRTEHALLRVAIRIPLQVVETCRDLSAEEQAKTLAHMRKTQECSRVPIPYEAEVRIDDQVVMKDAIAIRGVRHDKPMLIENEFSVTPGEHRVQVRLTPLADTAAKAGEAPAGTIYEIGFNSKFTANRIELVSYDANTKSLRHASKTTEEYK